MPYLQTALSTHGGATTESSVYSEKTLVHENNAFNLRNRWMLCMHVMHPQHMRNILCRSDPGMRSGASTGPMAQNAPVGSKLTNSHPRTAIFDLKTGAPQLASGSTGQMQSVPKLQGNTVHAEGNYKILKLHCHSACCKAQLQPS